MKQIDTSIFKEYEDLQSKRDEEGFIWWGYLHESGTIHAKRYFDERDLQEAYESPFCRHVFRPFKALDRDDALKVILERLNK